MKWRKLIHQPCGRMSDLEHAFEVKDDNVASGSAIVDADYIFLLADRMMEIAKSCDFNTANKVSSSMTAFLANCHFGQRAYECLYNIPATNFFQRVGNAFAESKIWRRDHPRAWNKFCNENGVEQYLEGVDNDTRSIY